MKPPQARVVQAQADAQAARARLTTTVATLQDRLSPGSLLYDARTEIARVRKAAESVVADRPNRMAIGAGIATILGVGWPLIRWRNRSRVAARAARIRGD